MGEVRSYKRRTKSGKVITVRAHNRGVYRRYGKLGKTRKGKEYQQHVHNQFISDVSGAKRKGHYIDSNGNVIYYDRTRDDFYTHKKPKTGGYTISQAGDVVYHKPIEPKTARQRAEGSKLYFKKTRRKYLKETLQ